MLVGWGWFGGLRLVGVGLVWFGWVGWVWFGLVGLGGGFVHVVGSGLFALLFHFMNTTSLTRKKVNQFPSLDLSAVPL